MANFFGCGFARVAVKLSILKANGKVEYDHEQRWKKYSEIFQGVHKSCFEVDKNLYTKRSKALEHHFKRLKTTTKKTYIEHFCQTNWEKLTEHEKSNILWQIARLVMYITSRINLYFPYGVTRQKLLHMKVFTNKLTVESLKSHLLIM